MFNADAEPASFVVPELARSGRWRLGIDTALPWADWDPTEGEEKLVSGPVYRLGGRSSAIVVARPSSASRGRSATSSGAGRST